MTAQTTTIARAFGLQGDAWMRHANPVSVWTRFAGLPLLVVAIWSRTWISWWALLPVALSVVWLAVNPLFFGPPTSTRNWASKSVLGERIWTEADRASLPEDLRTSPASTAALAVQCIGVLVLGYGLVALEMVSAVAGLVMVQGGKVWYLDRMVRLFETMKDRDTEYGSWDY